jgi:hypothetical protein
MKSKNKRVEPLPETFATPEDAGEFWDSHSTMDYAKYLETVDDVIEIKQRVFDVPVDEEVFQRLQKEAKSSHQSVPKLLDTILRKTLAI